MATIFYFKQHNNILTFRLALLIIIFIISLSGALAEAATLYYVDAASGNDLNNGISEVTPWKTINKVNGVSFSPGDSILFKRGETWREYLSPQSGDVSGYITYSAYGAGNKPLFLGSVTKNNVNDWTDEGGNIWSLSLGTVDVGNLIFDNEASVGEKVRDETELDTQGKFWYDQANRVLKLYSVVNPAVFYSHIECALSIPIINQPGRSYIIYENLDLRYGGAHGISGGDVHHIIVRDCDFSYIGGGRAGAQIRFGNAIEFWNGAHDTIVERSRLWEIYDAALTTQGASPNQKYNQFFRNNIIWNSEYCFEYWNKPSSSTTDNIYFENNTCVNAGSGWGHSQRWSETDSGWHNGRHLAFYNNSASTTNFYILNNIFYEGRNSLFVLWENWNGIENLVSDNNLWYQSTGVMIYYWCSYATCTGTYAMNDFVQYQINDGKDPNSLAADPLFNNIAINDFRPLSVSPACTMSTSGSFVGATPCVDIIDTDGDRMPDSFEILYGFDPDNPADADYDNDFDNLSNYWEYVLGTDPTDPDTDGDNIGDSTDTCPVTPPVNVVGTYYSSLQTAYDSAANNAILQSHSTALSEDLVFTSNKSIILEGGYNCNYWTTAGTTTINGNVSILDGTVTVQSGAFEIN